MMKQLSVLALIALVCMPLVLADDNGSPIDDNGSPLILPANTTPENNETEIENNETLIDNGGPITEDNETEIENNETEIDNETSVEIESMNVPAGAVVRFMQLEKQLDIKIERAKAIVSYLNTTDTTELSSIIGELELIKDEVNKYTTEEALSGLTVPQMAVLFIDLKNDSRGLILDFKNKLHELVNENLRNEFKVRIANINGTMTNLTNRILTKIRVYNSLQVRSMLGNMGNLNETLINEVMEGNINKGQIMQRLKSVYEKLEFNIKVNAALKILQRETQDRIKKLASIEEAFNNTLERRTERLEDRLDKFENKTGNAMNNVRERINNTLNAIGNWRSNKGGKK